jgi:hypothetical protein
MNVFCSQAKNRSNFPNALAALKNPAQAVLYFPLPEKHFQLAPGSVVLKFWSGKRDYNYFNIILYYQYKICI